MSTEYYTFRVQNTSGRGALEAAVATTELGPEIVSVRLLDTCSYCALHLAGHDVRACVCSSVRARVYVLYTTSICVYRPCDYDIQSVLGGTICGTDRGSYRENLAWFTHGSYDVCPINETKVR